MAASVSTINELVEELSLIQDAKKALIKNGQEHSLNGSHSFKGVDYSSLVRRERQIKSELAMLNGGKNYTLPNYSGSNANVNTADL